MTKEQRLAVAVAKRLAGKLRRRPTGRDLRLEGVTIGRNLPFLKLHALLVAADLATPAPDHLAGFTDAEERTFLRLWEEGISTKRMAVALGVNPHIIGNEVSARRLRRTKVIRKEGEPEIRIRRCQQPDCGKLTEGAGSCRHCGAQGLINAA
jgi:hypothetical protein